jgi:hypothetical protein
VLRAGVVEVARAVPERRFPALPPRADAIGQRPDGPVAVDRVVDQDDATDAGYSSWSGRRILAGTLSRVAGPDFVRDRRPRSGWINSKTEDTMKNRAIPPMVILAAMLSPALVFGDGPKDGIDAEGYVSTWLILAPIPMKGGQEGPEALDQEQIKDEASLKPKAGDKIEASGKSLEWKARDVKDQFLDFNEILGEKTENSVVYAVAYLMADTDLNDLTLRLGSDDQVKVYLNGKAIHTHDEGRAFEKDEDSVPALSLKKGLNVLVVKVVNEGEDWAMSARFLDKDGKPVAGLKATTKPD